VWIRVADFRAADESMVSALSPNEGDAVQRAEDFSSRQLLPSSKRPLFRDRSRDQDMHREFVRTKPLQPWDHCRLELSNRLVNANARKIERRLPKRLA
jgi:hypothetical protein